VLVWADRKLVVDGRGDRLSPAALKLFSTRNRQPGNRLTEFGAPYSIRTALVKALSAGFAAAAYASVGAV
jgi:hypothetical protein